MSEALVFEKLRSTVAEVTFVDSRVAPRIKRRAQRCGPCRVVCAGWEDCALRVDVLNEAVPNCRLEERVRVEANRVALHRDDGFCHPLHLILTPPVWTLCKVMEGLEAAVEKAGVADACQPTGGTRAVPRTGTVAPALVNVTPCASRKAYARSASRHRQRQGCGRARARREIELPGASARSDASAASAEITMIVSSSAAIVHQLMMQITQGQGSHQRRRGNDVMTNFGFGEAN